MKGFLTFIFFFPFLIFAQYEVKETSGKRPNWISKKNVDKTYDYYVGVGNGDNLPEAKNDALSDIIAQISRKQGVEICCQEKISLTKTIGDKLENGKNGGFRDQKLEKYAEIDIQGHTVSLEDLELSESYWQKAIVEGKLVCEYFLLARVNKTGEVVKEKKPFRIPAVVKSTIIPGWGQWGKQQRVKGLLFFTSIASSVGYGLFSHNEFEYHKERLKAVDFEEGIAFNEKWRDRWEDRRNIAFGVAGGLWVLNIIDAIRKNKEDRIGLHTNATKLQLTVHGAGAKLRVVF